jgi:hypothetical protein
VSLTPYSRSILAASHEGDETQAVLRSGVFTVSAIRNPQIAEEKKSLMDGKKSADGSVCFVPKADIRSVGHLAS